MDLVDEDCPDPAQKRVGAQHLDKHTFGHDLDLSCGAHSGVVSHTKADAFSDSLPQRRRHPLRRGERRCPPGLRDDDPFAGTFKQKRESGCLTGSRRGHDDAGAVCVKCSVDLIGDSVDRVSSVVEETVKHEVTVEADAVWSVQRAL